MDRAAVPRSAPVAVVFRDGFGERRRVVHPSGSETLELLCLRHELATVPSFEFALRERVSRLSRFRHACYARVRSVERIPDRGSTLAVVSEQVSGLRLSEILEHAAQRKVGVDINSALCLIRQLVPAVAILHQHARDVAHGCIAPERLVIGPNARLVILEHVLGGALEQLRFSPDRYWSELRVPVGSGPGQPRLDQRTDVIQIGLVALSLILGRPIKLEEYPGRVAELLASTWAISARGGFEPLPPGLRGWLGRMLQLDATARFESASDARAELDRVLGEGADRIASSTSLEAFLGRYQASSPQKTMPPLASLKLPASVPVEAPTARPAVSPPERRPHAASAVATASTASKPAVSAPPSTAPVQSKVDPSPQELPLDAATPASGEGSATWPRLATGLALLVALAVVGVLAGRWYFFASPGSATGTLAVTTDPNGADVFIDGRGRGITPLTISLPAGPHSVEVRTPGGESRLVSVTIEAGAESSQFIELPSGIQSTGELQVRTDPAGARVSIDGIPRGTTPLTVSNLTPGAHDVQLEGDLGSVSQTVTVESGATASLLVPLVGVPEGAPVSGWVSVTSPVELQLYEDGRLLGTSLTDRTMLETGLHEVELVNESLGFRTTRVVEVAAGGTAKVEVDVPQGTIALNAVPWAEVWIDGERIGETPLGNLQLPIGEHSILFRHPELGEQHHTATVTLKDVTRISVDLRNP